MGAGVSINGADGSMWQYRAGPVDIAAAADPSNGLEFMIWKATEGRGYTDPSFYEAQARIRATRLVPGWYHFARPDLNPGLGGARSEAQWFLDVIGLRPGELVLFDFEAAQAFGDLSGWAGTWLDYVAVATHASPFFYSFRNYIDTRGGGNFASVASKYALWLASDTPTPEPPWTATAMFQDAGQVHYVNGFTGPIDYDTFYGTRDQLLAYTAPAGTVSPVTQPPSHKGDDDMWQSGPLSGVFDATGINVLTADGHDVNGAQSPERPMVTWVYLKALDGAGFKGTLLWTQLKDGVPALTAAVSLGHGAHGKYAAPVPFEGGYSIVPDSGFEYAKYSVSCFRSAYA